MGFLYIDKVQVEGGFLDGLNVNLRKGLNTIIGARGTGKSTLIELIRFCLDVKGHTPESHSKSVTHAKSVLKDGQVSVTLSDGINSYNYTRTSDGETSPKIDEKFKLPLIFSQTEVENIGLVSNGRLKLIDDFIEGIDDYDVRELSTIAIIESYSSEIINLTSGINETEDKLLLIPDLEMRLKKLNEEQNEINKSSEITSFKNNQLSILTEKYINRNKYLKVLESTREEYIEYIGDLNRLISHDFLDDLINYEYLDDLIDFEYHKSDDLFKNKIINHKNDIKISLGKTLEYFDAINNQICGKIKSLQSELSDINIQGQKLRSEVDTIQKGAGELSRVIQKTKSDLNSLVSIKEYNLSKKEKIKDLRKKRDDSLQDLYSLREEKSLKRHNVCNEISNKLSPKIRVHLEACSQLEEYQQVVINALKGSGIKYNELAPIIAESIPPILLLKIIEDNDVDLFIEFITIGKDRAIRVISALKSSIDKIATVKLEDEVVFELLDGSETKKISDLSTGQRCTVILPVILEHKDSVLIVDQPEDHIDNAFIVETLIASIKRRNNSGQTIVTTHNANVPVLGNADEVIHLNSDGTRGYIVSEGPLSNCNIIEAISNVMEGGREAFKFRAEFYD